MRAISNRINRSVRRHRISQLRRTSAGVLRLLPSLLALLLVAAPTRADDAGRRLEAFTGAHSRLVWVQDQSDRQDDTLARGGKLRLMGVDSRDGRGERALRPAIQNFAKPLLTPDGSAVVYSDHFAGKVFVVDWQTGESRELCAGFALDVWADPVTGATWVYTATRGKPRENFIYRQVRRMRIDGAAKGELVWDATQVGPDNFQLSADGLRAAGEFPWPDAGVADLARASGTSGRPGVGHPSPPTTAGCAPCSMGPTATGSSRPPTRRASGL